MRQKALQKGAHAHVAACLSEKARPKIDHRLEWSSENKLGAVSPWVVPHPRLGVPSQENLTRGMDLVGTGVTEGSFEAGLMF